MNAEKALTKEEFKKYAEGDRSLRDHLINAEYKSYASHLSYDAGATPRSKAPLTKGTDASPKSQNSQKLIHMA